MNVTGELPFRLLIGLVWTLHLVIRIHYRRKVRGMGDYVHVHARRERWLFRLFACGHYVIPFYFASPWLDFAHLPLPGSVRWPGAALAGLGLGLFTWTHAALGRNWTAVPALSPSHELVTRGPYRRIRHPMYASFYAIGSGYLLASANWLVGAAYLGTLSVMYVLRVDAEERMMLARFGEGYRQHLQQTGRLWPRIGR